MENVGTLSQAVKAILNAVDELSDESNANVTECAKEILKLQINPEGKDVTELLMQSSKIHLYQMEIDRRTTFLNDLMTWMSNYLEVNYNC